MSWNRAVQIFKAIVIIMIIVVFGIMGYWQIQLNKNKKKLEELKIKIEKLNEDYNQIRETYKNEIDNEVE